MDSQVLHVMTISNSIIGVSLLAMPYCFKQCGIILSILILIASSILSRLSCHLLLKSAIIARRRTFEVLAFHTFGSLGKFMTEIGIIGFLIGTCIAFFVIMGDLGPTIVAKITGTQSTDTMRTSILMALALFCVLPLGLLRNIDSLSSVCTATIGFYFCLVVKIMSEACPHLFSGDWIDKVELWRPSGILQCLPIFSMALSCQTQIFEIYQVVQNASLEKMNNLIRVAINICSCVYIFVGTFGYIAFCNQTFTGNILMSFSSTILSDAIKIGFILSVAFSFPLVIFPCRASLYSLLYKQTYSLHEGTDKYIPESRFKGITFVIIFIPLVIGIMIPNIELVLGLMGSTIGIMICVIFPATCFICISTKNTNERVLAQIMLFFGILIMVLGTYANLVVTEVRPLQSINLDQNIPKVIDIPLETKLPDISKNIEPKLPKVVDKAPDPPNELKKENTIVRHEPPQPQEPSDSNKGDKQAILKNVDSLQSNKIVEPHVINNKLLEDVGSEPKVIQHHELLQAQISNNKPKDEVKIQNELPVMPPEHPKGQSEISEDKKQQDVLPLQQMEVRHEPPQPIEPLEPKLDKIEDKKSEILENNPPPEINNEKAEPKIQKVAAQDVKPLQTEKSKQESIPVVLPDVPKGDNSNKEAVDMEAIKKEEKTNLELLKTLEKQNKEQQKLVEESQKVLEVIKQRQHDIEEKKEEVRKKEKQAQLQKNVVLEIDNNIAPNKSSKETIANKKQTEDNLKLNRGNLLPLPIVLSNSLTNKGANIKDTKVETVPAKIEQTDDIKALPEMNKEQHNNENDLPVLHREIRSADGANFKNSIEVACDTKATEKPLIIMDTKLSNQDIVKIKDKFNDVLSDMDAEVMKPLQGT